MPVRLWRSPCCQQSVERGPYVRLLEMPFDYGYRGFQLSKSLHPFWINDGLMAIFFQIGLELQGRFWWENLPIQNMHLLPISCSCRRYAGTCPHLSASTPGHTFDGWGVPVATDIAFALGALALLGERVPKNLLILPGCPGIGMIWAQWWSLHFSGYPRRFNFTALVFQPSS